MNITLRPAGPADLHLLRRWDEQPHVIASDPNDDWNWEYELTRNPDWREHFIAEADGRPVGFVQIINAATEESYYWGDVPDNLRAIDIWLGDEHDLGKGYGTAIMKLAIEKCFRDETVEAILIDPLESNTRAHRFYERIGFEFLRNQQFNEDACRVYQLTREKWQDLRRTP